MTGYVSAPPTVDLPTLLPSALLAPAEESGDGRRRRTVRDWIVDVTCFVLGVGGGLVVLVAQQHSDRPLGGPLLAVDLVTGMACCAALWARRRRPVAIMLVAVVAGVFSITSSVAGMIMLFTVAVHRRARIALVLGLLNVATVPVFFELRPSDDPLWVDLIIANLVTAVVLGWGMFARARRQLVVSLGERARRAETEQQLRVDQARRMERARIAREMHDVLAHRISLLSVHAGALEFRTDANREQVAEAAGVIRANAHQALQELREVIGVLREDGPRPDGTADTSPGDPPPATQPEPPQPGLREIPALVAESTQAGARVEYRCELPEPDDVPRSIARTAYRVVQEGLTNARKHAPGAVIDVALTGDAKRGLIVEVVNPIPARPVETSVPGAGLGLVGLTERVHLAGGRLDHGRSDGGDRFVLRARLPWRR